MAKASLQAHEANQLNFDKNKFDTASGGNHEIAE